MTGKRFSLAVAAGALFLAWVCLAATAAAEGTVKIALVLARTGPARMSDISGWPAAQLAVEEVNRDGGLLGCRLELLPLDTQSTPIGAARAAQVAAQSDVVAVIGAGWSSQSIPMARVLQSAGVPMITPTATHPDVTKAGDYIFRLCFSDAFQGKALAKFAHGDLSAASAVVLRNVSEPYSVDLAQQFAATYRDLGGVLLWQGDYKTHTADFTAQLERIKHLQPDIVFTPGYEQDCGKLIRQAATLGVTAPFLGGDGWGHDILRTAGKAASGSYYLTPWHPDMPSEACRELVRSFRQRFPQADYYSLMLPMVYDAVRLLADAVVRAGTFDRAEVRDALARTEGFPGVTGPLSFDADGNPVTRTAAVLKFDDEKLIFSKAVRFP